LLVILFKNLIDFRQDLPLDFYAFILVCTTQTIRDFTKVILCTKKQMMWKLIKFTINYK